MTIPPILSCGSLASGFRGHAANDDAPLPHVLLQGIMDECLHSFIHDFDQSVRSVLGEMNLGAQLERQNRRDTALPPSIHLEIAVGEHIPLDLWQMAVTSYHDEMLKHDEARFRALSAHLSDEALAHTLATSRYKDADSEHESMKAFSRAYVEDIKVFALARDLFRQNIPGIEIALDMHRPAAGFIVPVMIITPKDGTSDLRLLIQGYVESKQGKRHLGLVPV